MLSFLEPGLGVPGLFESNQLDPVTQEFFEILDNNDEPYWQSEVQLINSFVKSLKSEELWDLLTLIWMPVGEGVSATGYALKHPQGIGTLMTLAGFEQSDWDRNLGLNQSASGRSIITGTTEVDYVPSNDTHMMLISETQLNDVGPYRDMGNTSADTFQIIISFSGAAYYRSFAGQSAIEIAHEGGSTRNTEGVFIATKKDTDALFTRNRIPLTTGGSRTVNNTPDNPSPGDIHIFRGPGGNSFKRFSGGSIGKGLTLSQIETYESILQKTRDDRKVLTSDS